MSRKSSAAAAWLHAAVVRMYAEQKPDVLSSNKFVVLGEKVGEPVIADVVDGGAMDTTAEPEWHQTKRYAQGLEPMSYCLLQKLPMHGMLLSHVFGPANPKHSEERKNLPVARNENTRKNLPVTKCFMDAHTRCCIPGTNTIARFSFVHGKLANGSVILKSSGNFHMSLKDM